MPARAKNDLRDLRAIRERYERVMEEQVIRPMLADLKKQRATVESRLGARGEATAQRALQAELKRVDRVIEVVSAASTRLDGVGIEAFEKVLRQGGGTKKA